MESSGVQWSPYGIRGGLQCPPDVWERMLNDISPLNPFPDVPIGLRFGFDMGVHTPPSHTITPPNHSSALSFPEHAMSHI
jgi:hypothetical protein